MARPKHRVGALGHIGKISNSMGFMCAGRQSRLSFAATLGVFQQIETLSMRYRSILVVAAALLTCIGNTFAQPSELSEAYNKQVVQRLEIPSEEAQRYAALAAEQLRRADISLTFSQYVAVVDRSPQVQAILVYWFPLGDVPQLIGASPASTGRVGQFDHFETPLGVFDHSLSNPDFRAEGTKNELGFRGYGAKGMRVYDLGWQQAKRGWGTGADSSMRLQMHSTDPDLAESKLGTVQSKGCIRIPATLNRFLDHFGVLDAGYAAAAATNGRSPWVLLPDRKPVVEAGRYLIIVDSERDSRPDWSPKPE